MLGSHKQVQPIPLTPREMEAFDRAITPPQDPFQAWLGEEIFTVPHTPASHRAAGVAGFITGGFSGLVTFYLAENLMTIFGANKQVGEAVGVIVLIPRIALGGNAMQDWVIKALHDYRQANKLPQKNNQRALRYAADVFAYVSSAGLGLMGAYILWNNLPYNVGLKSFFLPSIVIGSSVVSVRPLMESSADLFAKYSQGMTPEIREKRAAIIEALNLALHEIRGYDGNQFDEFYREMTARTETPGDIQTRWENLLKLSENPTRPAPAAKSAATVARGYFGWLLSCLSSLTNIQISYAQAKWLADVMDIDDDSFVPAATVISSVLCIISYGVLCAGPTRAVFENQTVKQGWDPSHPWFRKASLVLGVIFGFASAIPNASWPIVLGKHDYEKALAGPAFFSPGSLYLSACLVLLNRLIDTYDRWQGTSRVVDHMDFLKALESLTSAVAQLPDETIDNMIGSEHPVLLQYRARHPVATDNAYRPMVKSVHPLNRS